MVEMNSNQNAVAQGDEQYKVVFVVGAGASKPFGLPIGSELKTGIRPIAGHSIAHYMQENHFRSKESDFGDAAGCMEVLYRVAKSHCPGWTGTNDDAFYQFWLESISDTQSEFQKSWHSSIDAFVASRDSEVTTIAAKMIIAQIVGTAQAATLFPQLQRRTPGFGSDRVDSAWMNWILEVGLRGCDLKTPQQNIAFITFNYDTILLSLIRKLLRPSLGLDGDGEDRVLRSIPIVHIYGKLQNQRTPNFMREWSIADLWQQSEELELIRKRKEGEPLPDSVVAARRLLRNARTVVFLGFGFDPMNIELLGLREFSEGPQRYSWLGRRVYSTAFKLGKAPREEVANLLLETDASSTKAQQFLGDPNQKCTEFLWDKVSQSIFR